MTKTTATTETTPKGCLAYLNLIWSIQKLVFMVGNRSFQESGLVRGGGGTVIPYPCKSGGVYPLSLKVLPFELFYPLSPKVLRQLSFILQITCPFIPFPSNP